MFQLIQTLISSICYIVLSKFRSSTSTSTSFIFCHYVDVTQGDMRSVSCDDTWKLMDSEIGWEYDTRLDKKKICTYLERDLNDVKICNL